MELFFFYPLNYLLGFLVIFKCFGLPYLTVGLDDSQLLCKPTCDLLLSSL